MTTAFNRRQFIAASAKALATTSIAANSFTGVTEFCRADEVAASDGDTASETANSGKPWLRKSFKANMFYGQMTMVEHFAAAKEAGFDGIEILLPAGDISELVEASRKTGLIIDGSVGNYSQTTRHTDSDDDVRDKALQSLKEGLVQTGQMGGDSIQINPGHAYDGTTKCILKRVQDAIESAIPIAEKNKVSILIENLQNRMFYDPNGGPDQSADALIEFIDRFDSPWVGVHLDIAAATLYWDPAKWIRALGPRMKKLDVRGFSRKTKSGTKIGSGDIDWPSVEAALREVNYTGWVVAEFGRSHISRLKEISRNMESQLHCSQSLASVK